jgi:hypothetical protein
MNQASEIMKRAEAAKAAGDMNGYRALYGQAQGLMQGALPQQPSSGLGQPVTPAGGPQAAPGTGLQPPPELLTRPHADALEGMKGSPSQVHQYLTQTMGLQPDSPQYMEILNRVVYPETNRGNILGVSGGPRNAGNLGGNITWDNWGTEIGAGGTPQHSIPRVIRDMLLPPMKPGAKRNFGAGKQFADSPEGRKAMADYYGLNK